MIEISNRVFTGATKLNETPRPALWGALRLGRSAWGGAVTGAVATGVTLTMLQMSAFRSGYGALADAVLSMLAGFFGIEILCWLIVRCLTVLRRLPKVALSAILSAVLTILALPWLTGRPNPLLWLFVLLIVLEALFGLSVAALLGGELTRGPVLKRVLMAGLLVLTLIGNAALFSWLADEGHDVYAAEASGPAYHGAPLNAPNPAEPGPFTVATLTYGSGIGHLRPEYGAAAAFNTTPVDASLLLPFWHGPQALWRNWYWGFGPHNLPLNARVWYPKDAPGACPLLLIAHGNHPMEKASEEGYGYLGELLASRGYIVVSVDENFLNVTWLGDWEGRAMAVRAWLILQHLKVWREWNATAGHPFAGKVALDRIALLGHSRGGEAVAIATLFNRLAYYPEDARLAFDFNFNIRTVVALAPTADLYQPAGQPLTLKDVNYFVMHGGYDSDVNYFYGSRQYHRVKFTQPPVASDDANWRKAALYLYRANHNQFNTVWGDSDWQGTPAVFLNRKPLLAGDQQRQLTKVFVSAFLETTLRAAEGYWPLFRDQRAGASWLPETLCLQQSHDAGGKLLSDYEEDVDPATASQPGVRIEGARFSVWREEQLLLGTDGRTNQDGNVVRLAWEPGSQPASYRFQLPEQVARQWQLNDTAWLALTLANASAQQQPVELTVELTDAAGESARLPLRQFAVLHPPLPINLVRLPMLESIVDKVPELVPQTVELPLAEFMQANPRFAPGRLTGVTLWLERHQAGAFVLDEIGFNASSKAEQPR